MPSPRRLFHTIVVLGAALSHCGGKAEERTERDNDGGGSDGDDVVADAGRDPDATREAEASAPCVGTVELPESCSSPADFFCEYCPGTSQRICDCDAAAPDSPDACAKSQDYHCQNYDPMTGCSCAPGSPASPSDCTSDCTGRAYFSCGVEDPPIGCDCITVITSP